MFEIAIMAHGSWLMSDNSALINITRNGFIDLWRFIAMMMIMAHHLYHIGAINYPFSYGWIFVEFFFILSGYFTISHFDNLIEKSSDETFDEIARNSILYTLHKFKSFMPFVFVAVVSEYFIKFVKIILTNGVNLKDTLIYFKDMPMEILLISSSYTTPKLVPLWYLSAMFIVFPVFCLLLQVLHRHCKNFLIILAFVIPILFYGAAGVRDNWKFPLNIIRAFSCMMSGVFIFEANNYLLQNLYKAINNKILIILQLLCMILPVAACYFRADHIIILCFITGVSITLSGQNVLAFKNTAFVNYLGKITMPIYLFHWVVGSVISGLYKNSHQSLRIFLYYIISIAVACLSIMVYNKIQFYYKKFILI